MRPEIIHVVNNLNDFRILQSMGSRDLFYLMNIIEFVDEDVKQRWVDEYNELFRLT